MRVHSTTSRPLFAALAALFLFLPAACERRGSAVPTGGVAHPAAVESGIAAFFNNGPVPIGSTRDELTLQLGEPDSTVARTVTNRHDPSMTDSVLTLFHDGLVAEIHRAGYDGKEMLSSLVILDDRYLRPESPVRIGSGAAAVQAAFGEPDDHEADTLLYMCDECLVAGHETVRFVLDGAAVRRIEIGFWVD